MHNPDEIQALIKLLDDPDYNIFETVSTSLIDQGDLVIPQLEMAWEQSLDQQLQERIENIIQIIQFRKTRKNMQRWVESGAGNLLEGLFFIAQFQYPDLDFCDIQKKVQKIKKDIWLELNDNLTALEKIRIFNHIIFEVHKFSKNSSNYYSPQNSFINQVLETKKGNAISLAVLYIIAGEMLDIPVYGVNLPKNFILVYRDDKLKGEFYTESDRMLFYINPFNRGAFLGKKEIDHFLKQIKLEPKPSYYLPCSNVDIVKRILQNLIYSYELVGFADRIERVLQLLDVLSEGES